MKAALKISKLRASNEEERQALKSAVKRACRLAGGAASVQHATRVGEAELSRYAAFDHSDRHCPIDIVLELDREAQAPVILSTLAALLGYALVQSVEPDEGTGCTVEALRDTAHVLEETSQFISAVAEGAADGKFSRAEQMRICQEADDAIKAINNTREKIKGRTRQ